MSGEEDLHPISVLIEELKDDDLQTRLNSVQRLSTIALALGEETTRTDLIPYLKTILNDEDEILLAIAEQLGEFADLVGVAHVHAIFEPLEFLARTDETVVREKAVESLKKLLSLQSNADAVKYFVPLAIRLGQGDSFSSKASACSLIAAAFDRSDASTQENLIQSFSTLAEDDTPIVRRNAAANLGKIAASAGADITEKKLLPLLTRLLADNQDTVRQLAIGSAIEFAPPLGLDGFAQKILPMIVAGSKDRSWRVRNAVAEKFGDIQENLSNELVIKEGFSILNRLLKDQEPEVRTQACRQLNKVGATLAENERQSALKTQIMPTIKNYPSDESQHVRIAFASTITALAPIVGSDLALTEVVPIIIDLLKDEIPEVRLNVISDLGALQDVIGKESVAALIVPEIVNLVEESQWRVRLAIIEQLPVLARNLGQQVFDQKLTGLVLTWLTDSVFAIRESVATHLKNLVEVFGSDWCQKEIAPKVIECSNADTHTQRLTSLLAISHLASVVSTDLLTKTLFPAAAKLSADGVPNVRFNAAKCIESILDANIPQDFKTNSIKPVLDKMSSDADVDVRFYTNKALAKV